MSIYMVNGHIMDSYLLGIKKMKKSSTTRNIYELVIKNLKETVGMVLRTCVNPPLYFVGIFCQMHMLCNSSH